MRVIREKCGGRVKRYGKLGERRFGRGRRGTTAVEFALVVPLLLLLVLGATEIGFIFYTQVTVQKAASMGARFAVTGQGEMEGNRVALIQSEALRLASHLHGNVSVEVKSWDGADPSGEGREGDAGGPCDMVEVQVLCEYETLIPYLADALGTSLALKGVDRKVNEPWHPCEQGA